MKRILFAAAFFAAFSTAVFAQESSFAEGERLFRQNKSSLAVPFLEKAIAAGENPKAYNYLALCYFQEGNLKKALDTCASGMEAFGTDKKVLAFNAGNIAFAGEDYENAEKWYTKALVASPSYAPPYLNRGNARLRLGKIDECREDYVKYLELVPDDVQKPQILTLLSLLDEEKERLAREKAEREAEEARLKEEAERLAEQKRLEDEKRREEEARLAELKRQEEERKRAEEAEKRRRLLEDVAASLKQTESENMLAGSEGTIDYEYETELE